MQMARTHTGTHQAQRLLPTGAHRGFGNGTDPNVGADTQFKEGQSGNPAGKPKGAKNLSTVIQEMLNDPSFIDRLVEQYKDHPSAQGITPDPDFQNTPMKAMITVALMEAINPAAHPKTRADARKFLAQYGYGTSIDITSKGERISETPKIISVIRPRDGDASTAQTEAS